MSITEGPTPERLKKSGGNFVVGGDARSRRVYCFNDSPIERLFMRGRIGSNAYRALLQFRFYWYAGGLCAHVSSVDLDRIWAADVSSTCGMARSERQAFYRKQYREARIHAFRQRP
jgi:hypothetical protein